MEHIILISSKYMSDIRNAYMGMLDTLELKFDLNKNNYYNK